jgi:hypothetical protein
VGNEERVARAARHRFELEALSGGFDREPFADASREYVFVARRRLPRDVAK